MDLRLLALGFLHFALASPLASLPDLLMVDDTMSVGTFVREARAAPPENFHKSYETEGNGEIGYSRKKSGSGKKGYQHFDSFHQKAGDNYELETEDSYGQEKEGQAGAHSHPEETREEYREDKPEPKEKKQKEKDGKLDEKERDKEETAYIDHEELREGSSDGNGGVEAHGHDPADYILPEKYTYGNSDEEYNF